MSFYVEELPHKIAMCRVPLGYWYLATPYSKWPGGLNDAAAHACALTARLIERGIYTYSPIAHSHAVALHSSLDPHDHSIWMPLDEQLMRGSIGLLVADLYGWHESKGVKEEISWFSQLKRPIHLLSPEDLSVRALATSPDDLHSIPLF